MYTFIILVDLLAFSVLKKLIIVCTPGYRTILDKTAQSSSVYREDRYVCNRGRVRYQEELARVDRYPLSRSFVVGACALPAEFSLEEYMTFLDNWGMVCKRAGPLYGSTRTVLFKPTYIL